MKLRITYTFDITDVPSEGVVRIEDAQGTDLARGENLQQALDKVYNTLTMAGGFDESDFTFAIVDVNPAQDAELINREASLLRFMDVVERKGDQS